MAKTVRTYSGSGESVELLRDRGELAFVWHGDFSSEEWELARYDLRNQLLRIFPRQRSSRGLEDQFDRVKELRVDVATLPSWDAEEPVGESELEGHLELVGLPRGFGKIFRYGLGLQRGYRGIIHALEEHTACTVVHFRATDQTPPEDEPVFHLSLARFSAFRVAADRNRNRGTAVVRRVNHAEAHNSVADLIGVEPVTPVLGRHPLIRSMAREVADLPELDADDRRLLVEVVSSQSRSVAKENPSALGRLRQDLELVSLEALIEQFEAGLTGAATRDEGLWQEFFEANPFALQQLFASPVVIYKDQLVVRGSNAFGSGERVADFVLANTVTRTALVVEIKTPAARLVKVRPYRGTSGSEVHVPHGDLLGAIAQVQAQMQSAQVDLPGLLGRTPGAEDLETTTVGGAVIVGMAGDLPAEQLQSFLRFRHGLAGVEVIAFDEVLARLRNLWGLLAAQRKSPGDDTRS
ncbi:Shedu anti-phage system protein SduA domain-containing protein [Nocardioides pinisoli]|uniref:DUF4263 domain-containing protein n=1 Tax=Nocardioides pinisoli TaxID=2950279 RepID=A0ABT1KRE3_9ACTN|nr:Shedu anti-phage system protein SduA domain-containing protein [Nocardioides pinisoli]MCP3420317.1 DUF4263 domain-containing protein [Nocardioides pinisoli]